VLFIPVDALVDRPAARDQSAARSWRLAAVACWSGRSCRGTAALDRVQDDLAAREQAADQRDHLADERDRAADQRDERTDDPD
jgi:hypothetical protein